MTKVYVVVFHKGCHDCAGEVEAVFGSEDAANTYVKRQNAELGYPLPYPSDEGLDIEEHDLREADVR